MEKEKSAKNFISKPKIYLAILLGLSISGYLLYKEINKANFQENWAQINWTFKTFGFLVLAVLMMATRDIGYMIRLRLLTDKVLSWNQCLKVVMMWEFASAISPGVVGGSAVAMFILKKEKIPLGKSTALVITTALFDNIFYLTIIPLIVLLIGSNTMIPKGLESFGYSAFWIGYSVIVLIATLLSITLFLYPKLIKHILMLVFKLPFLKKRKPKAIKTADDIILASKFLKGKPLLFWIKLYITTSLSWIARFMVVNCIIMAFVSTSFYENVLIFARQLVMWLMLLITPTPGGSGMAEYLFNTFLNEFLPVGALVVIASILWRLISYYPYLFIGSMILPKWIKK